MMFFGLLIPLLLIGVLVYAAGWRPQSVHMAQSPGGPGGQSSLDVLRERYARGEINREEYQRMRQDLQEG